MLQVALDNGIEIPHYCYHPKLSIDGSCRMCQVKIEKAPKLAIACNTPVADGMVVDTTIDEVAERATRRDGAAAHQPSARLPDLRPGRRVLPAGLLVRLRQPATPRTTSPRRKGLKRHPIGPRVVFDQERCILCRRCVRFTKEISKTDELRVFGIGDRSLHRHRAGPPAGQRLLDQHRRHLPGRRAAVAPTSTTSGGCGFSRRYESVCPSCSNGCNVKLGILPERDPAHDAAPQRRR